MVAASAILDRAGVTLFDPGHTRWTQTFLLECLSDSQREVVLLKPSAHCTTQVIQLVAGTRQVLPAGAISLIDLGGNMGADGTTPGRSVTQIDRTVLEASLPNWRADQASLEARHYIYDDRAPTEFAVWPPQPSPAGHVEATFSTSPDELGDPADPIALPEVYLTPLYYLVLARAYAKSGGSSDFAKASSYRDAAISLVTGREGAQQRLHPEQMKERSRR